MISASTLLQYLYKRRTLTKSLVSIKLPAHPKSRKPTMAWPKNFTQTPIRTRRRRTSLQRRREHTNYYQTQRKGKPMINTEMLHSTKEERPEEGIRLAAPVHLEVVEDSADLVLAGAVLEVLADSAQISPLTTYSRHSEDKPLVDAGVNHHLLKMRYWLAIISRFKPAYHSRKLQKAQRRQSRSPLSPPAKSAQEAG